MGNQKAVTEKYAERKVRAPASVWVGIDAEIDLLCGTGTPRSSGFIRIFQEYLRLQKQVQMGTRWAHGGPTVGTPRGHGGPVSLGTDLDPTPSISSPTSSPLQDPEGDPRGAGTIPEPKCQQSALDLDPDTTFILDLWAGTPPFDLVKDPLGLLTRLRAARPDVDVAQTTHDVALWWAANPSKQKKQIARFLAGWWARQGKALPNGAADAPRYKPKMTAEEQNAAAWARVEADPNYKPWGSES